MRVLWIYLCCPSRSHLDPGKYLIEFNSIRFDILNAHRDSTWCSLGKTKRRVLCPQMRNRYYRELFEPLSRTYLYIVSPIPYQCSPRVFICHRWPFSPIPPSVFVVNVLIVILWISLFSVFVILFFSNCIPQVRTILDPSGSIYMSTWHLGQFNLDRAADGNFINDGQFGSGTIVVTVT